MKIVLNFVLIILLIGCQSKEIYQDLKLPSIISDHMVLQQDAECVIWGLTNPNMRVKVSIQDINVLTTADVNGKWRLNLPVLKAGGPYEMKIKAGTNVKTISDILVGENWVGSGQSNMEWRMDLSKNAKTEIPNANFPNIRLFSVPRKFAETAQEQVEGEWVICTPENIKQFSSVLYYFGKKIHQTEKVPIGLIHSSWGGTPAETWVSIEGMNKMPEIDFLKKKFVPKSLDFDKDIAFFKQKVTETSNKENALTNIDDIVGVYDIISGKIGVGYATTLTVENKEGKLNAYTQWNKETRKVHFKEGVLKFSFDLPNYAPGEFQISGSFFDGVLRGSIASQGGNNAINGIKRKDVKKGLVLTKAWQQNNPSFLYNAMINPLIPYTIKGVIWYQGEANVSRHEEYHKLFSNLITNWRMHWGQGDFPFYFVQLAPFAYDGNPSGLNGAKLREAQFKTLQVKNTGMAVITDIGNVNDIHPTNKIDVAQRLALWALAKDYGHKDLTYSGPLYKSMNIEENTIRLEFDCIGSGLVAKDGPLTHFSIAGEDRNFVLGNAKIDKNTVVVSSPKLTKPIAVRFGFMNGAEPNLFNKEGLPASTFRTDNW